VTDDTVGAVRDYSMVAKDPHCGREESSQYEDRPLAKRDSSQHQHDPKIEERFGQRRNSIRSEKRGNSYGNEDTQQDNQARTPIASRFNSPSPAQTGNNFASDNFAQPPKERDNQDDSLFRAGAKVLIQIYATTSSAKEESPFRQSA
jgi:hypothetical protein